MDMPNEDDLRRMACHLILEVRALSTLAQGEMLRSRPALETSVKMLRGQDFSTLGEDDTKGVLRWEGVRT